MKRFYDFSPAIKRALAERVAYMCSRPLCRRLTIKPVLNTKSGVNRLGEAGHIYGASNKGPRSIPNPPYALDSIQNGIWLCNGCHKLVDTEHSTYDSVTLEKYKADSELYTEGLVIQDTRLRQLRIICTQYLSALRILSGLPVNLDETFENSMGNRINLTRLFMELELILMDNEFKEEAEIVSAIVQDLDELICPFVNSPIGKKDISEWKKLAVRLMMLDVMRFSIEAYEKYQILEDKWVQVELRNIKSKLKSVDLDQSKVYKLILSAASKNNEINNA
jgi:hypothetical protein